MESGRAGGLSAPHPRRRRGPAAARGPGPGTEGGTGVRGCIADSRRGQPEFALRVASVRAGCRCRNCPQPGQARGGIRPDPGAGAHGAGRRRTGRNAPGRGAGGRAGIHLGPAGRRSGGGRGTRTRRRLLPGGSAGTGCRQPGGGVRSRAACRPRAPGRGAGRAVCCGHPGTGRRCRVPACAGRSAGPAARPDTVAHRLCAAHGCPRKQRH